MIGLHAALVSGANVKNLSLLSAGLALSVLLTGCEPTYGGLSVEGFNYTPYNLDRFVISDKFGNTASGGGDLPPGSGAGSLSCCYGLKGTEFTVNWTVYDADEAQKALLKNKPIQDIKKSTTVHLPPTAIQGGANMRILGLHFYPDDHIEFEFRTDLRGSRLHYGQIDYQLMQKYKELMNPEEKLDEAFVFRRTARVAADGWKKYRLTDTDDLEQYVYFTLFVGKDFDRHPVVKEILRSANGTPGAFGRQMEKLPKAIVKEIREGKTG